MDIESQLRQSLKTLSRNKLRSFRTVLGITIGIAAVICVVSIGNAASKQDEQQLSALGDNFIWVEAGGRTVNGLRTGSNSTKTLLLADAQAILAEVPVIKRVSPQVDGRFTVVFNNKNWSTQYRGESADYVLIRKWDLASGVNITEEDVSLASNVCVLGNTVKEQLFGNVDPVGNSIRMNDLPCKVIGVLAAKGSSVTGQDQDDFVLVPYTTAPKKISGITWLKDIMCSATSSEAVPAASEQIVALLRERHRIRPGDADDFNMRTPQDVIEAGLAAAKTFSLLLISVASVALLVGGIGIMNVMLVSVTERTREIGVRLAIGATEEQVRIQFLIEALVLSLFGGMCGVLLGITGSFVLGYALEWPISIPPSAIALSALFSSGIGVFFGLYPAIKASRLNPVEALRFE
jgi:putative ABC transport system permease protein